MSAKSNQKAKRPRVVPTLKIKLKIITDFEAGKCPVDIGWEHGVPSITVRTIVALKNVKLLQN
jgi:hypothetical protein